MDSEERPSLVVEPGEAINREGRAVVLKRRAHLSLLRAAAGRGDGGGGLGSLQPCARLSSG